MYNSRKRILTGKVACLSRISTDKVVAKNLHLTQKVNQVKRLISGSCLDHLWVSHPVRIASVKGKLSGLSDHLPITALRKYNNES